MSLWLINKLKYSCGSSSIPFLLLLVNLGPLHTQARRPTTMAMWELSWVENVETFQVYLTLGGERPKGPNNSLWMENLHVVLHDMLWIRVHGLLEFASCPLLGGRLDANSGTLWQWKQLTMVARVILIFFPTIIFTWNISIFFPNAQILKCLEFVVHVMEEDTFSLFVSFICFFLQRHDSRNVTVVLKPNNGANILLGCREVNHNLDYTNPHLGSRNLLFNDEDVEVVRTQMPQNVEDSRDMNIMERHKILTWNKMVSRRIRYSKGEEDCSGQYHSMLLNGKIV